jgi:4-hydroxythreonine-4-phosphate dehydrogenase
VSRVEPIASRRPRIVLTSGEPAGVGPELCAQLMEQALPDCELICLGDRTLIETRARGLPLPTIEHYPLCVPSEPGRPDPRNADYVIKLLDVAIEGVQSGRFDAMVTAPVQKNTIAQSGREFSGHTEYLAEHTGSARPVMMLVADDLRVALVTTHLPLREVPDTLSTAMLLEILSIMDHDLRHLFEIGHPRIGVLGLNPHAGENGLLGQEDQQIIVPAIEIARSQGIHAFGPVPADTAFITRERAKYDAILSMFHDQGLPVLKALGFDHAVNITLGLPIIRTSVDHGTALNLADTRQAEVGSLLAALRLAAQLASRASRA